MPSNKYTNKKFTSELADPFLIYFYFLNCFMLIKTSLHNFYTVFENFSNIVLNIVRTLSSNKKQLLLFVVV